MAFFWGGLGFGGRSFSSSQYSEEIPLAVVDLSQSFEEVGHAFNWMAGLMDMQNQIVEYL